MPGFTAYSGLLTIGQPKPGETVVVAAASGAVGSVVGQIARIKGARAVGIVGGPDKCAFVRDEMGLDAVVDHQAPDFAAQLAARSEEHKSELQSLMRRSYAVLCLKKKINKIKIL